MVIKIDNRADWLKERRNGIGGSDAACVLGANPYKTNVELWREKTGRAEAADISEKPCVKFGKEAEKHIRGLFTLSHADEFEVEYSEFDIHRNEEYPFIFATLDGILTDRAGRKGVLEIKTTEIRNNGQWQKWENQIPQNYYVQILHQLIATGFDFAVVCALIRYNSLDDTFPRYQIREYRLECSEVESDMQQLLETEIKFWESVKNDTEPPLILPI